MALALPLSLCGAAESRKAPVVSQWAPFEHAFKSSVTYSNPIKQVSLTAFFISPRGETNAIHGFWDGGKTWRIRFSPDQPGRWAFKTACSDEANRGLHQQRGEFICSAPTGTSRFNRHGPIRVARNHGHFEHADGSPFFWLADSVWDGARLSEAKDWEAYAEIRASQNFTVAQFAVGPGEDSKKQAAFTWSGDQLRLHPDYFKRLDSKIETLSRAGILSAIAPVADAADLPEEEATLLVGYVVARYGAEPVAWLALCHTSRSSNQIARWARICKVVFPEPLFHRAPLVLCAGKAPSSFDELRNQSWIDALAIQSVTDMKETMALADEWKKPAAHPTIFILPAENGLATDSKEHISADQVGKAAYSSLLKSAPCGLSYAAQGVANWDPTLDPTEQEGRNPGLPLWQKALFMPGARQMKLLGNFVNSLDFWRLHPEPQLIADQPGNTAPHRFIAASAAEAKDLSLIYIPEDRTLEILLEALPASPNVSWFNPRTGETSSAVAVVGSRTCQFPTPDPGDWVLVMKAGKQ